MRMHGVRTGTLVVLSGIQQRIHRRVLLDLWAAAVSHYPTWNVHSPRWKVVQTYSIQVLEKKVHAKPPVEHQHEHLLRDSLSQAQERVVPVVPLLLHQHCRLLPALGRLNTKFCKTSSQVYSVRKTSQVERAEHLQQR